MARILSSFRIPPAAIFLMASFLTGVATMPLRTVIEPPARNLEELEGLGQNVLIGTLGGLRALMADLLWIRANVYWEQKNYGLTEATSRAVTRLQPDIPFFWIQTARTITFDAPIWRFGGRQMPPKSVEQRIRREQAERGIEILNQAEQFLPDSAAIAGERARIYWIVLGNLDKAEKEYEEAYRRPNAPPLYARMRALILMDQGREEEALEWLELVLDEMDPERDPGQYRLMREHVEDLRAGQNPQTGETFSPDTGSGSLSRDGLGYRGL